jgi:hypothetical protein
LYCDNHPHALVQSQACILKTPRGSTHVDFAVRARNYQSTDHSSAVLIFLVSSMGVRAFLPNGAVTSLMNAVDGKEAWFRATGLSTVRGTGGAVSASEMTQAERLTNMFLVVQVPLVHTPRPAETDYFMGVAECSVMCAMPTTRRDRGTDMAKISSGSATGKSDTGFSSMRNHNLRVDARFPVRITIQYYRIDVNGITSDDCADIAAQLRGIESKSVAHGSLVTEPMGHRTTEVQLSAWNGVPMF